MGCKRGWKPSRREPSIPYILKPSHGEAIHQGVVRGAGKVAGADGGETPYQGIAPAPSLC